jgi:hypothetical protein
MHAYAPVLLRLGFLSSLPSLRASTVAKASLEHADWDAIFKRYDADANHLLEGEEIRSFLSAMYDMVEMSSVHEDKETTLKRWVEYFDTEAGFGADAVPLSDADQKNEFQASFDQKEGAAGEAKQSGGLKKSPSMSATAQADGSLNLNEFRAAAMQLLRKDSSGAAWATRNQTAITERELARKRKLAEDLQRQLQKTHSIDAKLAATIEQFNTYLTQYQDEKVVKPFYAFFPPKIQARLAELVQVEEGSTNEAAYARFDAGRGYVPRMRAHIGGINLMQPGLESNRATGDLARFGQPNAERVVFVPCTIAQQPNAKCAWVLFNTKWYWTFDA